MDVPGYVAALTMKVLMKSTVLVQRPELVEPELFGQRSNLIFRSLGAEDFIAWKILREIVITHLEDQDHYVREADEAGFFKLHSQPFGHCIGAFAGDALVAYAMLRVPSLSQEENLACTAKMSPSSWSQAAHLASCMVHPDWRGHHLQVLLLRTRMALAQAWGRPLCLAMVSLRNTASRRNLMRQGLHVVWTGWIDGLQRHIMAVNLLNVVVPQYDGTQIYDVLCNDFARMHALTSEGFVGVHEVKMSQGQGLRFVRLNG